MNRDRNSVKVGDTVAGRDCELNAVTVGDDISACSGKYPGRDLPGIASFS